MSDRLPPLSPFTSNFSLDPWQKRVLQYIDEGKSVVVSAPTSSGKTLISTYVATLSRLVDRPAVNDRIESEDDEIFERVLFVVPTEPLVWQVAAHLSRLRENSVALVTDHMIYNPDPNSSKPPAVVVGTPHALETALTEIRGKTSPRQMNQLAGGFHHYGWVVYDEVLLDGDDGEAVQRLIRLMKCNFLALSATVSNAEELRSWLEYVRGEQLKTEIVDACQNFNELVVKSQPVHEELYFVKLETHHNRFLHIQRHIYIWTKSVISDTYELQRLHPLSAVSLGYLQSSGFATSKFPMTPRDSYELYLAMKRHYPSEVIDDLAPHCVFNISTRITLSHANEYGNLLQERLVNLSKSHETQTQSLLDDYHFNDLSPEFDICDLVMTLHRQQMLPCLIFQLNVSDVICLFKTLLGSLELRQKTAHPNYYASLHQNYCARMEEIRHLDRNLRDHLYAQQTPPDLSAPHPDFVLHPNGCIPIEEYRRICEEVQKNDHFEGDISKHVLMRALRRGIGIYINDSHLTTYRTVVMRLAIQGKLGVVLSDSSLAFGINMPFRSCVFCGEMGGLLTPTLAEHMAGRSGRRGFDTQAHLIYAGARASFIRKLMLTQIPEINGREPRYHTQFLQEMLSIHSNPVSYPNQMQQLGSITLNEYIRFIRNKIPPSTPNFRTVSIKTLQSLHLIEKCDHLSPQTKKSLRESDSFDYDFFITTSGYRPYQGDTNSGEILPAAHPAQLCMVWKLRYSLPDSLLLGSILPELYKLFHNHSEDLASQHLFLLYFMMTVDRTPYKGDQEGYCPYDLMNHPFVYSRDLTSHLIEYEGQLSNIQQRIYNLDVPKKELILQPFPIGERLDATLFDYVVNPPTKEKIHEIPFDVRQFIQEKLKNYLRKLMIMHNTLMLDTTAKYSIFEGITRKSFHLLQDLSKVMMENILNFEDISSSDTEDINDSIEIKLTLTY